MAHWDVEVEVDYFQSKSGVNRLKGGLFGGRTLIYSNLKHVVIRITPKYATDAENNAVLISSHIDTVFSTYGYWIFSLPLHVCLFSMVYSRTCKAWKHDCLLIAFPPSAKSLNKVT